VPTADELIGRRVVADLVACVARAAPGLDPAALRACEQALGPLGFGERVDAVRDAVLADLPAAYRPFAKVVRAALRDDAFRGWMIWCVADAVAMRALEAPDGRDFDDGLALLAELTPRHSAEAAIRRFLAFDLDRAVAIVLPWTAHPDEHVRRFASEGTRPRLPWARRVPELTRQPDATLPILDALHRDASEYVRRSVANHLNDVSRARPDLATATAARWLGDTDSTDVATARLVRHALRTLVKQGDPGALGLLGFGPPADVTVDGPHLDAESVAIGGTLRFAATLVNRDARPARLAVDYVVHYQKANGTLAPKVFKLTTRTLAPGERLEIARTHAFRPLSTRRHHPGEHALELQVNGRGFGRVAFALLAA